MIEKKLPIGIDNFEKIRKNNFYYVDKTGLIIDLLNNWCEVTLFTRPRRFGKTLNMSTLECFFSPLSDKRIFDGLKIKEKTELCENYMGKYPVISLTLKSVDGEDFETAYDQVFKIIQEAAVKVDKQISGNAGIHPTSRNALNRLLQDNIKNTDLYSGLYTLSSILEEHYNQKVIILIDEYDVPLANAYRDGYYEKMVRLIRNIFHQALKTNNSLQFAVLTGCMRISKESIFTGLNNLKVRSISDEEYDEYFGFTGTEVQELMKYYERPEYYDVVRDWYDGYRFGQTFVYCPWDVLLYCDKLRTDLDHAPENFWLNSSGNQIIRQFIRSNDTETVRGEIEKLLAGDVIEKSLRLNLTYPEMYSTINNIWSVLYTTGYLTQKGDKRGNSIPLSIPNKEICNIFSEQILELFKEDVSKDGEALNAFCDALARGDVTVLERSLNDYLGRTVSIKDAAVRRSLKENFYHGLLIGILGIKAGWSVTSNQEAGNGYSDIQIRDWKNSLGIIIEVKYSDKGNLEETCHKGLRQIADKHYAYQMQQDQLKTILKYGIAIHLKNCRVLLQKPQILDPKV